MGRTERKLQKRKNAGGGLAAALQGPEDVLGQFVKRNKELYSAAKQAVKSLERELPAAAPAPRAPPAGGGAGGPAEPALDAALVDEAIAHHLVRQGRFALADAFARDAGAAVPPELRSSFGEMDAALAELRAGRLGPGLAWVQAARRELAAAGPGGAAC